MVNKMVSYTGGKRDCLGPIQLAWMVNKIALLATHRRKSASPSRRAGWGRGCVAVVGLARHLLHHRGKLDGVGSAAIVCFHAKESDCPLINLCSFVSFVLFVVSFFPC
jgi:hypothetical protein